MKEIWKNVLGYEGWYEVSNFGRVKRTAPENNTYPGRIMRPALVDKRYLAVTLTMRGIPKVHKIHRLVARAFLPPPLPGQEINHKNGNKEDNRPENLEWITAEENRDHAIKNGFGGNVGKKGEDHAAHKLTHEEIAGIKILLEERIHSQRQIGAFFHVSAGTISHIRCGRHWSAAK